MSNTVETMQVLGYETGHCIICTEVKHSFGYFSVIPQNVIFTEYKNPYLLNFCHL